MPSAQSPAARGASLWRSFGFAWNGLVAAAATQRNMKIHLAAAALAGAFAALPPLSPAERGLIVLCAALVISAEAANTALEAVVDLQGGPPSPLGRLAKDAAAGAVLVLAGGSVTVFALVAGSHLRELLRSWRSLLGVTVAGAGLAVVVTLLLGRGAVLERAVTPITAAGLVLLAILGVSTSGSACVAVPALSLAVAISAARQGKKG